MTALFYVFQKKKNAWGYGKTQSLVGFILMFLWVALGGRWSWSKELTESRGHLPSLEQQRVMELIEGYHCHQEIAARSAESCSNESNTNIHFRNVAVGHTRK